MIQEAGVKRQANQKAHTWHYALVHIFHNCFPGLPLLWCFIGQLFTQVTRLHGTQAVTHGYVIAPGLCCKSVLTSLVTVTQVDPGYDKVTKQLLEARGGSACKIRKPVLAG